MALFPRRIGGRYAMLSRQDDENLYIMYSDSPHFWSDPKFLLGPKEMWNSVKVGNCGSPIETEAGWLVITHGVGGRCGNIASARRCWIWRIRAR